MTTLDTRHQTSAAPSKGREAADRRPWPLMPVVAAVVGLGAGALFGSPFLDVAGRVWSNYLLPAYLEIQKSGIPFCG